jgi:hypothetical protein
MAFSMIEPAKNPVSFDKKGHERERHFLRHHLLNAITC